MTLPRLRGPVDWAAVAAGVVLVLVTQPAGAWWMAMPTGLAIGLLVRGWRAGAGALLVGLLGWGLPLLWQARIEPVGAVAAVLGGLLGVPALAAVAITLLVGVLLALAGAWVGITARRLVTRPAVKRPPSSTSGGS